MTPISSTDLIINPDGSIYHLHLKPGDITDTIITVGDPGRVADVSKHFDSIDFKKVYREFVTHRGIYRDKELTVMSTGMGTDNMDIFLTELDALVNVDFKTRQVKNNKTKLKIVRVGTSGSMQADIKVGTLLASKYAVGLDSLMCYYDLPQSDFEISMAEQIKSATRLPFKPYCVSGSDSLLAQLAHDMTIGNTATCPGFYGPQGRKVRAELQFPGFLNELIQFRLENFRLTNFEMETAAYYAFGRMLGHEVLSLNAILANRVTDEFAQSPGVVVDELIQKTLERI